jgi:5-enolpyruvylshikimate-3-phosphate synthase
MNLEERLGFSATAGLVLGLAAEAGDGVVVPADAIATWFPTFAETLRTLGASL